MHLHNQYVIKNGRR